MKIFIFYLQRCENFLSFFQNGEVVLPKGHTEFIMKGWMIITYLKKKKNEIKNAQFNELGKEKKKKKKSS